MVCIGRLPSDKRFLCFTTKGSQVHQNFANGKDLAAYPITPEWAGSTYAVSNAAFTGNRGYRLKSMYGDLAGWVNIPDRMVEILLFVAWPREP